MIDIEALKNLAAQPGDIGYDRLAFWMADHAEEIIRELEEARKDAENWRAAVADAQKHGATTICSDERAKQIVVARQQKD